MLLFSFLIWGSLTSLNPMHLSWLKWRGHGFFLEGKQETCSPSVGLANSFGTAAPSSSSIASSSVRTPSIWISCSPEMASSSDLELSPVRRNLTTLRKEKWGWMLWWMSCGLLCSVSLEKLSGQRGDGLISAVRPGREQDMKRELLNWSNLHDLLNSDFLQGFT